MITDVQRRTIATIIGLFETDRLPSPEAYGTATILPDGAGISYGSHQFTAASSLMAVLNRYDELDGLFSGSIRPYLALVPGTVRIRSLADASADVHNLLALLRGAGADPKMRRAQDEVYHRLYLQPAEAYCEGLGLREALSVLAVADCAVQSGLGRVAALRPRFAARPPSAGGDERTWTAQFIRARHDWLAQFASADAAKQALVRRSSYRTTALLELVAAKEWTLETPLVVRRHRIA